MERTNDRISRPEHQQPPRAALGKKPAKAGPGQTRDSRARRPCYMLRRGTVLLEFVFCIPILAGIIACVFFFGWSMANQQRVWIADRYGCWQAVRGGAHTPNVTFEEELNQKYFAGKATSVSYGWSAVDRETQRDLVAAVSDQNAEAGVLAEDLVVGRFPGNARLTVTAEFPKEVAKFLDYEGPITSRHVRESVEWRRGQARCEDAIVDEYLYPLDDLMRSVASPGDVLAERVRMVYNAWW